MEKRDKKEKPFGHNLSFQSQENNQNLGLDADHSSESEGRIDLNADNDRVSNNPDGEDDLNDTNVSAGNSPLMDK